MNGIIRDIGIGVLVAIATAYVIRTFPGLQRMVVGSCNCPGAAPAAAGAAGSSSAGVVSPQPVQVGNAGPYSPAVGIGGAVTAPLSTVPGPASWINDFDDWMAGRGIYDSTGAG